MAWKLSIHFLQLGFRLAVLDRSSNLSESLVQPFVELRSVAFFDLPKTSNLQFSFAYALSVLAAEMRAIAAVQVLVGDELVAVHAWPPVDEGVVFLEFFGGIPTVGQGM
jgi:hypothetical protein